MSMPRRRLVARQTVAMTRITVGGTVDENDRPA